MTLAAVCWPRRIAVTTSGVLLVLSLATGCGDGDEGTPSTSREAELSESAPSSPSATAPPRAGGSADAPGATGPLLEFDAVSIRAPQGWQVDPTGFEFARRAQDPDVAHQVDLSVTGALGDVTLSEVAAIAKESLTGKVAELPLVQLDGVSAYHFEWSDEAVHRETFGTVKDGDLVSVEFTLDRSRPAAERREIVESVLATLVWS